MLTSLEKVKTALLTVTDRVYHYEAPGSVKDKYVVWAEDGGNAPLLTDNKIPAHVIEGTIDYYSTDEHDETFFEIPVALNAAEIEWELNSVQYEDPTRLIHYEWLFRVRQSYVKE